jgi:hypothetical protein
MELLSVLHVKRAWTATSVLIITMSFAQIVRELKIVTIAEFARAIRNQ